MDRRECLTGLVGIDGARRWQEDVKTGHLPKELYLEYRDGALR
jgi:hypothetical protein